MAFVNYKMYIKKNYNEFLIIPRSLQQRTSYFFLFNWIEEQDVGAYLKNIAQTNKLYPLSNTRLPTNFASFTSPFAGLEIFFFHFRHLPVPVGVSRRVGLFLNVQLFSFPPLARKKKSERESIYLSLLFFSTSFTSFTPLQECSGDCHDSRHYIFCLVFTFDETEREERIREKARVKKEEEGKEKRGIR